MRKSKLNNLKKSQVLEFDETVLRKIYTPMIIGLLLFPVGIIIGYFSYNKILAEIISFGLSAIVIGISGIWQIKFRIVPGIPALRGVAAIVFGVVFILMSTGGGIIYILATVLNW